MLQILINYFRTIFESPWVTLHVIRGIWVEYTNGPPTGFAIYEIQQHLGTKRLRLVLSGYRPKEHGQYPEAVQVFNQMNSDNQK